MPSVERTMVYVPDSLVAEARKKGMTNLSEFVRVSLKEYIKTGDKRRQADFPGYHSTGGHDNVTR